MDVGKGDHNQENQQQQRELLSKTLDNEISKTVLHSSSSLKSINPDTGEIRRLILQGATPKQGNRPKMWRILLLGSPDKLPISDELWKTGHLALGSLSANEDHVLNMDVPRTRGDLSLFKEVKTQESIQHLLTRWCLSHGTRYRQGLNEVLAPFIALKETNYNSESFKNDKKDENEEESDLNLELIDERERYSLFDAFVCKFLAAFYIDGDANINDSANNAHGLSVNSPSNHLTSFSPVKDQTSTLKMKMENSLKMGNEPTSTENIENSKMISSPVSTSGGLRAHTAADIGIPLALRLVDLCIQFHDPTLFKQLREGLVGPELYAVPWLCTALARNAPLELVWKLWDILIAIDDPAFLPILCIDLLRLGRNEMLRCEPQDILEHISKLKINSIEIIHQLRINALDTYQLTPRGLKRPLRTICCYINVGDESYEENDDDDEEDYDFYVEEVEEVAAAVVAAAKIPVNRAVEIMTKLDDAVAAAFTPPADDEDDNPDGRSGGEEVKKPNIKNNEDDEDEEEEEEDVSLFMTRKSQATLSTPKKEPNKHSTIMSPSSLGLPTISTNPLASILSTPNKTPIKNKKNNKSITKQRIKTTNANLLSTGIDKMKSSSLSSSFMTTHWSPRKVRDLCDAGIFILSPNELVCSLLSKNNHKINQNLEKQSNLNENDVVDVIKKNEIKNRNNVSLNHNSGPYRGNTQFNIENMNEGLLSWLVLDIRPKETSQETRTLATSLQLPIEVMSNRKSLDIWLQHFDSLKGAPICILDSSYHIQSTSSMIWKKLKNVGNQNHLKLGRHPNNVLPETYIASPHARSLADILVNELGFPLVSVFGGCFLDLCEEVARQQGGSLEPLVIDSADGSVAGKGPISPLQPIISPKQSTEQDEEEEERQDEMRLLVALREAEARGHDTVAALLRKKLDDCPVVLSMKKNHNAEKVALSSSSVDMKKKDAIHNEEHGSGRRPPRSLKEQVALSTAEEKGHFTIAQKLREITSTPKKSSNSSSVFRNNRSNSFLDRLSYSGNGDGVAGELKRGGSGWVEVDEEAQEEEERLNKKRMGKSNGLKSVVSTLGAMRNMVNRADEWVEKHMEGLLDDSPSKPLEQRTQLNTSDYDGNDDDIDPDDTLKTQEKTKVVDDEDEWTEVGVSMNPDVADALKSIQAAINPNKS